MTVTCNKCGIVKGFIAEKGNQTGLYCNKCGKWIKWLTKDEKRLFAHNNKTKMTNADRIRSMTDEELLDFLCSIETYDEGSTKTIDGGVAMCSVTEVEQWLKAESEE